MSVRVSGETTDESRASTSGRTPGSPPFARRQPPQGAHLPEPEVGVGGWGDGAPLRIDLVEQRGDKIKGGQVLLHGREGFMLLTSVEEVHDHDKKTTKDYWFVRY